MAATISLTGGKELARGLSRLSERVSKRVLTEALTDAAEPMRQSMARLAPREPGAPDLADHMVITKVTKVGSTEGGRAERVTSSEAAVAVGPAREFFYGLFQEYGTARGGKFTPFARPAFDQESQTALTRLVASLWRALIGRGLVGSRGQSTGEGLL